MSPARLLLLLPLALLLAACDTGESCDGGSLQIEDLVLGQGAEAAAADSVRVAYEGRLEDGTLFDSNSNAGFRLSRTIPGFQDGITGMREGGERHLTIPPSLAYGEAGSTNGEIPSCATLSFDVALIDVVE